MQRKKNNFFIIDNQKKVLKDKLFYKQAYINKYMYYII